MSILQNAIDSIAMGLEDFLSDDPKRVTSCSRNIYAGILLLFKHKLFLLGPPGSEGVLISRYMSLKFDDSQNLVLKGTGKLTVDFRGIQERFELLDIDVNWKYLKKLAKHRNKIEHYYGDLPEEAANSLIAQSFIVIRDFVNIHLKEDPKELLGDKSWSVLIEASEVYEKEKSESEKAVGRLRYRNEVIPEALQSWSCDECGYDLLKPTLGEGDAADSEFECGSCGTVLEYDDVVERALVEHYADDSYIAHKDGGNAPLADCPSCEKGTYLYEEGICLVCGHEPSHECQRCGVIIPPEEFGHGDFCGFCAHMMAKDD